METDPVSETLCFIVFRIPDHGKGQKSGDFLAFLMKPRSSHIMKTKFSRFIGL
jgi:hypothetical protein